jgi:hypothetical protein
MLEDLADPSRLGDFEDPRSLARWAKKMGSALGDEAGEDFGDEDDEMLEAEQGGAGPEESGAGIGDTGEDM